MIKLKKLSVYLDNCCFNRPFDNQQNVIIRIESEAKLFVQELILKNQLNLVWSFILDFENKDNPFLERQQRISEWKNLACIDCILTDEIRTQASYYMNLGLKQKDAAHIACAVSANADYFLTTDKGILNKQITEIQVVNPIEFVRRYLND